YNAKKHLEYTIEKSEDKESPMDEEFAAKIDQLRNSFIVSMEDDLNTADAVAALFDLVKFTNSEIDEKTPVKAIEYAYRTLMDLSKVLGILSKKDELPDEEIMRLINERAEARASKNFSRSDEIRD